MSGRATRVEQQNLIVDSEGMGGAVNWTDLGATGVANATPNPFGGANGAALVENGAVSTHERFPSASLVTLTSNAQWVAVSVWFAPDTRTFGGIMVDAGGFFQLTGCWNLTTGANTQLTFTAGSRGIAGTERQASERESTWVSGWRRFTVACFLRAGDPVGIFPGRLFLSTTGFAGAYAGDGVSRIFAWGAQYVRANWAGPYVRTNPAIVDTGNIRNLASV